MANKVMIEITEQNFNDEVLKSDLLVFSCFSTSWSATQAGEENYPPEAQTKVNWNMLIKQG